MALFVFVSFIPSIDKNVSHRSLTPSDFDVDSDQQIKHPNETLASLLAQGVKNLPTVWETQAQSLGWEDPLEKGKATHSSILARRVPWTEESGGLQSMGSDRVRHD